MTDSTAVSAMITVYPHNSDWDHLADLTGGRVVAPGPDASAV